MPGGVADYLWNHFLGGHAKFRPLGNAVLDGEDFDIERGERHYAVLARRLSELGNGGRKVYLTAAPQYGDASNLKSSWEQWTSSIPARLFFIGPPASKAAAGSGYIPKQVLISQIPPFIKGSQKYGGVMLWDRYNDIQSSYSIAIKGSV
ncbi:hypothetical protein F0562_019298 [Nyssa sinensis]|uniref:GH18 domain-containing protein n=1 Tax=Nyssa sinensis TaxID=561372 RepID=A0A5J4ZDU7_9ASTE|nr:hypothetical protein F0562_019298 [Nyssa sinensis]